MSVLGSDRWLRWRGRLTAVTILGLLVALGVVVAELQSYRQRYRASRDQVAGFEELLLRMRFEPAASPAAEVKTPPRVQSPVASSAPAIPLPTPLQYTGERAQLRDLPYPFQRFVAISNDSDSLTFKHREQIFRLLHEELALPLGDQVFVSGAEHIALGPIDLIDRDGSLNFEPADWDHFYQFLVWHRRGWIDSIHGWHPLPWVSNDTSLTLSADTSERERKIALAHENWQSAEQAYVIFDYQLSDPAARFELLCDGEPLAIHTPPTIATAPLLDDVWQSAFVVLPKQNKPTLTVRLLSEAQGTLRIKNLAATNVGRARMACEAELLRRYRTRFLTYTEHGKIRREASLGTVLAMYPQTRRPFVGDDPRGAPNMYMLDVLEGLGVRYINSSARTAGLEEAQVSTQWVRPFLFNDQVLRYGLERFLASPRQDDPSAASQATLGSMSWEPWLGFQLDKLRTRSVSLGSGGVIYTHLGVGNTQANGLSADTLREFRALAEAYYNHRGSCKPHERAWVASPSEVATLAQAMHAAREHVRYDSATNTVALRSWSDPIARQVIPTPLSRINGLGNLTIYVNDSASARVLVNDQPYSVFTRNAADSTGRQSITLVDDSEPTIIVGEVDLHQRSAECVSEHAEYYFRSRGGYQSAHCVELHATDKSAALDWQLPPQPPRSYTHFRFAYRKTNPESVVSLELQLKDGPALHISEGALAGPGWSIPPRLDDAWHDVVLPLYELTRGGEFARPAVGTIDKLRLIVDGAAGDSVFFDNVQWLSGQAHPISPDGKHLIAGRVTPPLDGVTVTLEDGPHKHTTTTRHGVFIFAEAVDRGSIVSVYAVPADGAKRFPLTGRALEVARDEVELSIDLNDLRLSQLGQNLKFVQQGPSEMTVEGGVRLKRKSMYTNSGIKGAQQQEWCVTQQVNNLGFLDKDRRAANPDGNRRVLLLGHCVPYGHSMARRYQLPVVLEDLLRRRLNQDVEVPLLAQPWVNFGKYAPYIRTAGRAQHADVACALFYGGSEIVEADADLLAELNEYDPDHLPHHAFRSRSDGTLEEVAGDPEYFLHIGQDTERAKKRAEERKQGPFYLNGLDWSSLLYREQLPAEAQRALEHFERVAARYRDEFAQDGTRFMIALLPDLTIRQFHRAQWKDVDGQPCRRELAAQRMEAMCRRLRIGFVDMAQHVDAHYPNPYLYTWRYDSHASPYGMQWIAESLAEYLIASRFAADLPYDDLHGREALAAKLLLRQ